MITTSATLFRYISKKFLLNLLGLLLILLGLIFIFDLLELLRRAEGQLGRMVVPLPAIISMTLMKLPETGQQVIPFAILFAAIYTCWKLNKTHELVVIRSAGLSAWQFLSPMIFSAILFGAFSTAVLNPLSSLFLSKFEQMEIIYLHQKSNLVTVSRTGIWLRQPSDTGYALIHAATFDQRQWRFKDVIVFFFDQQDSFQSRIDADSAALKNGMWEIYDVQVNDKQGATHYDSRQLPTDLTPEKIEESFANPETISFWKIPEYLSIMEDSGFPTTRLEIHFHALLAQPFLLAAMILLAATFSLRPQRFGGTGIMIALGVGTGFFIFFMVSVLHAFGISQKISVYLAAWTPAAVSLLLGTTALLHMEDG